MSRFWKTILIDIVYETLKRILGGKKNGMEPKGMERTEEERTERKESISEKE